jgi:hypothetical protein
MIADTRPCRSASGSVTAKIVVKAAMLAPVVNHLCALITHSSPSRTAVDAISVGSEPATSGSVRPTDDRISPSTSGLSHRSRCSSLAFSISIRESCMDHVPTAFCP